MDQDVEIEMLPHPSDGAAQRSTWPSIAIVIAAVVVAVASAVVAWAQLEQTGLAREQRCLQRAQAETLSFSTAPDEAAFRERLAQCGD